MPSERKTLKVVREVCPRCNEAADDPLLECPQCGERICQERCIAGRNVPCFQCEEQDGE